MFRTWIIRQRNTVWVRKLTDIVTSLDSKLVSWTKSYSKWYMYVETFLTISYKELMEMCECKQVADLYQTQLQKERRRIHRWIS